MLAASVAAQVVFLEDFEDGNVDGWVMSQPGPSGNGTFEAVTAPDSPSGGDYVGKKTFGVSCYGAQYLQDPVTPDYISWYFRADGDTSHASGISLVLSGPAGPFMTRIGYRAGFLQYRDYTGTYPPIMAASAGTWYLIELKNIDWGGKTFDIWVDNDEKVGGVIFESPTLEGLESVSFYACGASGQTTYVDNITFLEDGEAPVVAEVAASPNPSAINQPIALSAFVDDSQTGNSKISEAVYAVDGGPDLPMSAADGAFDGSVEAVEATLGSFDTPDVHTICVRGTDAKGNISAEECVFLAVYDPSGGFVTGGGWIWSEMGWCQLDEVCASAEGKANFGFVSKYKKGATVPTGQTEFQFKVADLNFHSESYEWLVVAGSRARYKGTGTINGDGEYYVMVVAVDANINPNDAFDLDRFRIKIWSEDAEGNETVVYDNGLGAGIDDDYATTEISGGSIVIHDK